MVLSGIRPDIHYSQMLVFVRSDLSVARRCDLEDTAVEGLWLEILLPKSRGFLLGTFYRPPNSSHFYDQDFMLKLDNMLDIAGVQGQEMIVLGDFNCNFNVKKDNISECKQLKLTFKTHHLTQLIKEPTRVTIDSSTLLDLIASNNPRNISKSGVIALGLSDHDMIYCVRKLNWRRGPAQLKTFRNYARYNPDEFCKDLKDIDWSTQLNSQEYREVNDVELMWEKFKTTFVTVADRHAPSITKRVRGIDNCPWMTGEIKRDIRQREYHLKKARKLNCNEYWASYRYYRNSVTNKIRKAKAVYSRKLIEENKHDQKAFWKTVKKILPGETKNITSGIMIDDRLSTDKYQIANAFNKYFIGVVTKLRGSLGFALTFVNNLSASLPAQKRFPQLKFDKVSEHFILTQLRSLKSGKAVGLDNISPRLLKDAAVIITNPLTQIINASLSQASIPADWKAARVIPLYKAGKANQVGNYRPISVLPVISKLVERAVQVQLGKHLSDHNILSPFQCGFRKAHSTETAAISLTDTIRRNIDQGLLTGAVFIDLSKAFDTVDHALLLQKLRHYGIENLELKWFEDYLTNRMQVVDYQNAMSDFQSITSGVPQGSILGPLLFILLVNDLPSTVVHCSLLMYADDTVLFYSAKDVNVIEEKLNENLGLIGNWLRKNSLFINKEKTECLLFGTPGKLSNIESFQVHINDYVIKRVSKFKYLGIHLDECLSWKAHIKSVVSKAGKRIGMLGRLRSNLTTHSANVVYTSFIRPVMEYGDTVWTCCGKVNAQELERLQNRAARIVTKCSHSDTALSDLKWDSLECRRERHVFNLVKKSLRGQCPQFLRNYFILNKDVVRRVTRLSNLLHLPKVRTETAKRSFYYNGCIVFNKLSSSN